MAWNVNPIGMTFDGSSGPADYQCQQPLGDRYCRIQFDLPGGIGLEDTSQIQHLIELADPAEAQTQLTAAASWLEQIW